MSLEIKLYEDGPSVARAAAEGLVERLRELLALQSMANIVVTGGTVGILTLAKISELDQATVEWNRVHVWWGDERFVGSDSPDRNAVQAREAWLSHSAIPRENIHEFPSADFGLELDEAAAKFNALLKEQAPDGADAPEFDILLLGMGPDGHVASLFPGKPDNPQGALVIAEHDSPKPPPQRLSFSYELINSSKEVWLTIAGLDKAEAVRVAFSPDKMSLPVGRVFGTQKTIWFLDNQAASAIE